MLPHGRGAGFAEQDDGDGGHGVAEHNDEGVPIRPDFVIGFNSARLRRGGYAGQRNMRWWRERIVLKYQNAEQDAQGNRKRKANNRSEAESHDEQPNRDLAPDTKTHAPSWPRSVF